MTATLPGSYGVTNLGTVTMYVRDQDAALDFYRNKLGWDVRQDLPMDPDNRWLAVAPRGGVTEVVLYRDPDKAGGFSGIVLQTGDIQATYAALNANGVPFVEPPSQQEWGGIQALFTDQDGNTFVLVQLPPGMRRDQ